MQPNCVTAGAGSRALTVLFGLLALAPVQAVDLRATDTTGEFFRYWDATAALTQEQRAQRFLDTVVAAHPELFNESVLGKSAVSESVGAERAREVARAYVKEVAAFVPRMRQISESIGHDLDGYARAFLETFPDYRAATPVYFTVSLFSFDGATREVKGHTALLFGIDGIARYHRADEKLSVLFDHELFHQYHAQVAPEFDQDRAPLWLSLWEEGLATYVSQQMNPGTTDAVALMSPALAGKSQAVLPILARELLANFDSLDQKEYAAFFYGSNGRADIPPRAGYYVGLLIAREIAAGRPLTTVANLQGASLRAAVFAALQRLCTKD